MYNLKTKRFVRTYKTDVRENVPLPVVITQTGVVTELITGCLNGAVCVYRGTGDSGTVDMLGHDGECRLPCLFLVLSWLQARLCKPW